MGGSGENTHNAGTSVYFQRLPDGGVEIRATRMVPAAVPAGAADRWAQEVLWTHEIDASSWASIVSSVSAGGEVDYRFYAAQAFHESKGYVTILATGAHPLRVRTHYPEPYHQAIPTSIEVWRPGASGG